LRDIIYYTPEKKRQRTGLSTSKETSNNTEIKHDINTFLAQGYQIVKAPLVSSLSIVVSELN